MNKKAQGVLEYVVIFTLIVSGLAAMSFFLKRAVSGRLKASADELSDDGGYSPGKANSLINLTSSAEENSTTDNESTTDTAATYSRRVERDETLLPFANEPGR